MKPIGRGNQIRLLVYSVVLSLLVYTLLKRQDVDSGKEIGGSSQQPQSLETKTKGDFIKADSLQSLESKDTTTNISSKVTTEQEVSELFRPIQFSAIQLQSWLDQKKGNTPQLAQAKIVAGMLLYDAEMVRAGVESDPGNPQAAYIGATHDAFSQEEQLQYSRQFFQNAPENALASYLYAARLFESGNQDAAIKVLHESMERHLVDDYSLKTKQLFEEAYLHAGASELTAKLQSWANLQKPYLSDILAFAGELDDVADSLPLSEAGNLRQVTASMGKKIRQRVATGTIIEQLAGLAIEEKSMEGLADDEPSHYEGMTTREVKESILHEREEIKAVLKQMDVASLIRNNPDLVEAYAEDIWRIGELEVVKRLIKNANNDPPE